MAYILEDEEKEAEEHIMQEKYFACNTSKKYR
jgi:hypothetical protein